jgi:hypothetical protein
MKWVTRERPKIDRVACPWLIKRFVDSTAEFLYVPADEVMETAARESAIPFDVPDVELGHHGSECSFDAIIRKYDLSDTYGVAPVVLSVFAVATYRLRKSAVRSVGHAAIAAAAVAALIWSDVGIAAILLLAGGTGLFLFHSKKVGAVVLVALAALLGLLRLASSFAPAIATTAQAVAPEPNISNVALFFSRSAH